MEVNNPYSERDVAAAIQFSFQLYSTGLHKFISPDALLKSANSQRRDIFQLFFEALEERKADLKPCKTCLRGKIPFYYQQDLEQACSPTGAAALVKSYSRTSKGKQLQVQVVATHIVTVSLHVRIHC